MKSCSIYTKSVPAINIILLALSYTFALNLFSEQYHSEYICPIIIALLIAINTLFANQTKCNAILKPTLLVTALFGIIEVVYSLTIGRNIHPIIGTYENPSILAMSVTLYMPALLYFYTDKSKVVKAVIIILYLLSFTAIAMSQSRAGIICMAICGIYILWKTFRFNAKYLFVATLAISITVALSLLFVKSESTTGRQFILERSLEMIKEKPLGWGCKGFSQNYMDFQAEYFRNNNDEEAAMLADNMRHPLNEYIYIAINYGLPTISAILLLTVILVYRKQKENSNESHTFLLTATMLAIWMMFSYPLSQPFTWNIMYIAMLLFVCNSNLRANRSIKGIIIIFASVFIFFVCRNYNYRHQWEKAVETYHTGKNKTVPLAIFDKLKNRYGNNAEFLYSYATLLYNEKQYEQAISVAEKCDSVSANYDLEILLANSYMFVGELGKAEKHYIQACNMCPNRFIPLYKLFKIYKQLGDTAQMLKVGKEILNKKIKVPSKKIDIILNNVKYELKRISN